MDEELEKLYQELINNRITYRGQGLVQVSPPHTHQNLIANPLIANYDFTSLYPGVQKRYYKLKVMIRKKKIQRMFQNPS
jgi:hypothetical protein